MMKKVFKTIFKFFLLLSVAGIIFVVFANYSIKKKSGAYLFSTTSKIPDIKTAYFSEQIKH